MTAELKSVRDADLKILDCPESVFFCWSMTVQGRKGLLQILTLYGMGTEKIEEKTGVAVSTAQECPFGLITLFVSQWND